MSKDIKNKKITEYTAVIAKNNRTTNPRKRTIGETSPSFSLPKVKRSNMENIKTTEMPENPKVNNTDPITMAAENTSLSNT